MIEILELGVEKKMLPHLLAKGGALGERQFIKRNFSHFDDEWVKAETF